MTARPSYANREQVAEAMDIQANAYSSRRIDRCMQGFSRLLERKCQRPAGLFPTLTTLYLDWPEVSQPTSWRLWLRPDEAISLVSLTSGGTAITGARLVNGDGTSSATGPPYNQIQLDRSGSQFLGMGSASTPQRSVAAVLWTGWTDDQEPAGTLAAAISSTSATTCTCSDSSLIGVGDQMIVESERAVVTGRAMASTSQTTTATLAADRAVVTVPVSSGAAFGVGEVILFDSERAKIVDISGNNLTVRRAWDGSVLAAHASGLTVYAPRLLTVARAAQGTAAATHAQGTVITRWLPPPESTSLVIGESMNQLQQEASGFARQISDGEGGAREVSMRGLKDLRAQVFGTELRRRGRSWAV